MSVSDHHVYDHVYDHAYVPLPYSLFCEHDCFFLHVCARDYGHACDQDRGRGRDRDRGYGHACGHEILHLNDDLHYWQRLEVVHSYL